MLSYIELQTAYIDLYKQLRKYIWDFKTVEKLAELEVLVYQTFPDIDKVSAAFNSLKLDIRDTCMSDEELQTAETAFEDALNSADTLYAKLNQVNEVIT